jgi:hypothetical protein
MRSRAERDRLSTVVKLLDIPRPFDIYELAARLAASRRRPIELKEVRTAPNGASGLWVATRDVDYICYERDTSRLHQEHIILHELGHLLCGHTSVEASPGQVLQFLMPTLDPAMVRAVLGRTGYSEPEERQAETFAMLVLERAKRFPPARRPRVSRELTEVLERIEAALTVETA